MSHDLNRRHIVAGMGAVLAHLAVRPKARAAAVNSNREVEYGQDTLAAGIRSRFVDNDNGVRMHVLEAGFESPGRPCVVFLHGFPELAYTWRNQLLPVANAGFHAIAPDLRGYGRSVATPVRFNDDLLPYSVLNLVSDVLGLIRALGLEKVAAVVGHDWGGPTAAWCALVRPDVFQSVVLVSTPFDGPPDSPVDSVHRRALRDTEVDMDRALARLPRPRKHYQTYLAARGANEDLWHPPQGVHNLLRAWFYFKSADWKGNRPFPLKSWAASELAKMPEYYIMDFDKTVAATMAAKMPSSAQIAECTWLTEASLQVYSDEYMRTGFQGGLNAYRVLNDRGIDASLNSFSKRTIDVPSCYIAGASDWGIYQSPGVFEGMQHRACTHLLGVHLVEGAGHSVVEEKPAQTNQLIIDFLHEANARLR